MSWIAAALMGVNPPASAMSDVRHISVQHTKSKDSQPLRAPAAGARHRIHARLGTRRLVDGFEPMGCDGSRIECPRTPELERGLGQAGKKDAAPTVWLTAFVHPPTGLLRSWRLGPGTAAEREHLRSLLATLSAEALIVCDAASMGFEPVRAILGAR